MTRFKIERCILTIAILVTPVYASRDTLIVTTDPLTRYCHIKYYVPPEAPNEVMVRCSWSPWMANQWQPARVMPYISETAIRLAPETEWQQWMTLGRIIERNAAGLTRTVVFDSYPQAQSDGKVDIDFRIQIESPDGKRLAEYTERITADNSDVVYLEDWSCVFQKDAVSTKPEEQKAQWHWCTNLDESSGASYGNDLHGFAGRDRALPQLSYPLDLKGNYAIFVKAGSVKLRLTGDERTDRLSSQRGWPALWRWTMMDRQHLVLKQPHEYNGWAPASIDYVKLVPLSKELTAELDHQFSGIPDKFVAGYWEPYMLGTEERTSDNVVGANREVELLVRARDGGRWLEQRFILQGERKPR